MNNKHKEFGDVLAFARSICTVRGWELNPDIQFRDRILQGLSVNYNRYGYFMCPCRDGDGDRAEDKDITCPCAYAAPDVAEYGHCFCALYHSPQSAADVAAGKEFHDIPERRGSQD